MGILFKSRQEKELEKDLAREREFAIERERQNLLINRRRSEIKSEAKRRAFPNRFKGPNRRRTGSIIREIGSTLPNQKQSSIQSQRSDQNVSVNFFEHKSNQEVYGDEDLTLFDSQKKRRFQNTTGSFFGM